MRTQTVVAGVIAGAVAACTGAAVDMTGQMMRDAGGALAGAAAGSGSGLGATLAGAGAALEAAGQALAGRGGSEAGALAQSSGDGLPRPHWVLRDARGVPVRAIVEPYYPQTIGALDAPPCVVVEYHEQRRVGLLYSLATGKPDAQCPAVGPDIFSTYIDAACTAPIGLIWGQTAAIEGKLYRSGSGRAAPAMLYKRNGSTQACEPRAALNGELVYPYTPLPSDLPGLLSAAPYTLELAY